MRRTALTRRTLAAVAAAATTAAVALAAAVPAQAEAPVTSSFSYYQAVVNLPPDEGGFAGSVSFRRVVGGPVSVAVNLVQATTVTCEDGDDVAQVTIETESFEATEPGPVTLDIDRRLRTAHGEAVVNLIMTESPGCGAPETSTLLPAQVVVLDVTGTSVRFRTGIDGSVSTGADRDVTRVYDLSRDGTGSVSVGSVLTEAASDGAFLKYAVERRRTHGDAHVPPPNAAPEGGTGAVAAFTRSYEPQGGLGVVFEDVFVTATASAPPERAGAIDAFAARETLVTCPDGGTAVRTEASFGAGVAQVEIDHRLADAQAAGSIEMTRIVVDGCAPEAEPSQSVVTVPASLSLTATGPTVRVRDTFFQVTPGEGNERTLATYLARDAEGTVSVGDVSGAPDLAAISRAGR